MSVYRCSRCENIYDADYDNCYEDPFDKYGCICYDCSMLLESEWESRQDDGEKEWKELYFT